MVRFDSVSQVAVAARGGVRGLAISQPSRSFEEALALATVKGATGAKEW